MKKRPERLIFIDETGNHNQDDAAARLRGFAAGHAGRSG